MDTSNLSAKVVLYNDIYHTYDDIIYILIEAIKCSADDANHYAKIINSVGQCIIYTGDISNAMRISAIIDSLALKTEILF